MIAVIATIATKWFPHDCNDCWTFFLVIAVTEAILVIIWKPALTKSNRRFWGLPPHPSGPCSLGIFNDLPWGEYGYFLELHSNKLANQQTVLPVAFCFVIDWWLSWVSHWTCINSDLHKHVHNLLITLLLQNHWTKSSDRGLLRPNCSLVLLWFNHGKITANYLKHKITQ